MRALALVGVPFRLRGRDPARGLDCVGVAALATGKDAPTGYGLRGGDRARFEGWLADAGLMRVEAAAAGDLVLVQAGPGQFHLMVRAGSGHVHAHAGLGRVVEMPGPSPWPVLSTWRGGE